ncbi:hypothetical protein E3N88_27981 [Mikania micrantha]|uniref:Uncharacterized protein n=1 Tax=Mikania micrantha TaxID=192012 RepID=A0A5N6MZC4_9ASTR|nr:hypothetical protein E3N88_27981 [Mikania micrantha]
MGETKKPVLAMDTTKGLLVAHINHNPVTQLQAKYKELETRFKDWLAKQSLPVEAAVVTATSFVQGAAIRGLMGTFTSDLSALQPPAPPDSVKDTKASSSSKKGSTIFIICIALAAVVGLSSYLFKLWQKKKREEQHARLLKLFEEDDELDFELGLSD